jgi:hypothetical protein
MTELLDVLKEAALDTGFLDAFETSASRVALSRTARSVSTILRQAGFEFKLGSLVF